MMRTGSTSDQASINTNPPILLRLLLARELCDVDPAPELPPSPPAPSAIARRLGRITTDITASWRAYWKAALAELGATEPPASGSWTAWPSAFAEPTGEDVSAWGVILRRPSRGTPLEDHPSRRYWQARMKARDRLPERIVVLPVIGHFAALIDDRTGILSSDSYLAPADDFYGFSPR